MIIFVGIRTTIIIHWIAVRAFINLCFMSQIDISYAQTVPRMLDNFRLSYFIGNLILVHYFIGLYILIILVIHLFQLLLLLLLQLRHLVLVVYLFQSCF
jgi:hypothetical protein